MKNRMERRTTVFLAFMIVFFGMTGYLTYYSRVVYLGNLPAVTVIMPERTGDLKNGRYTYVVPEDSIKVDPMGKTYILTARYQTDIIGERYLATRIDVWVLERRDDNMAIIDGMVREEPVLTGAGDLIGIGDSIVVISGDEDER